MTTAAQIRAARALLGWTQTELAERSGLSLPSLSAIETTQVSPRRSTVARIVRALEDAGVIFTNGDEPGVKMRAKG